MKKAAVIFHSVCGNTYLMAKAYKESLEALGIQVDLLRVKDDTLEEIAKIFDAASTYKEEIVQLPVASAIDMEQYDILFMGAPTYFGNVSGQMKQFMDSFCDLWVDAKLQGKLFGAFATSGTSCGGSEMCLQALNIFAQHMGMTVLSVPANIKGVMQPAYGMVHYTGETAENRPQELLIETIKHFIQRTIK